MESIDSKIVMKLRARTGAPVITCRSALSTSGGDLERAVLALRRLGIVLVSHRPGAVGANGVCASYVAPDGRAGVLLEMNCETDFVARTDEFLNLCRDLGRRLLTSKAESAEQFLDEEPPVGDDMTARTLVASVSMMVGEKLDLRRFARYTVNQP